MNSMDTINMQVLTFVFECIVLRENVNYIGIPWHLTLPSVTVDSYKLTPKIY